MLVYTDDGSSAGCTSALEGLSSSPAPPAAASNYLSSDLVSNADLSPFGGAFSCICVNITDSGSVVALVHLRALHSIPPLRGL